METTEILSRIKKECREIDDVNTLPEKIEEIINKYQKKETDNKYILREILHKIQSIIPVIYIYDQNDKLITAGIRIKGKNYRLDLYEVK